MDKIEGALLNAVGERAITYGFNPRPQGQTFVRRMADGQQAFHLAFIEHPSDFDVVGDVAVRFDAVENLINQFHPRLSNRLKLQTYTVGAELGNIAGEGQKRWTVASTDDVLPVADDIVGYFQKVGLPYLETMSSMRNAYRALTLPGSAGWMHSPIHAARAKRIVALAKLLEGSQEMSRRIDENTKFLESTGDSGIQDFKKFAVSISTEN